MHVLAKRKRFKPGCHVDVTVPTRPSHVRMGLASATLEVQHSLSLLLPPCWPQKNFQFAGSLSESGSAAL